MHFLRTFFTLRHPAILTGTARLPHVSDVYNVQEVEAWGKLCKQDDSSTRKCAFRSIRACEKYHPGNGRLCVMLSASASLTTLTQILEVAHDM